VKTLHLVVTVTLLQVLYSTAPLAHAAEGGEANGQTSERKYAEPSPIPDYILREGKPYKDLMRVIQPSELPTEIPCERVQVGRYPGSRYAVFRSSDACIRR
jgi:hypothetical protein